MDLTLTAILLGIVEGLTEFIPVSSTGHLILASEVFGYDAEQWKVFNVVIQLGAILAVVVQYWRTFWAVGNGLLRLEPISLRFLRNILLGFIPSAILGLALKSYIDILLGSPLVVGWALLLGGIAILAIERVAKPGPASGVGQLPAKQALGVGLVQCISMIPGVSRSGATIMGALAMGIDRRTAAEFSFFLAIPTMLGAVVYDTYKNYSTLTSDGSLVIAIGFVAAFVAGLLVVRSLVAFVGRYGFTPFGWYRIALGVVMLAILSLR